MIKSITAFFIISLMVIIPIMFLGCSDDEEGPLDPSEKEVEIKDDSYSLINDTYIYITEENRIRIIYRYVGLAESSGIPVSAEVHNGPGTLRKGNLSEWGWGWWQTDFIYTAPSTLEVTSAKVEIKVTVNNSVSRQGTFSVLNKKWKMLDDINFKVYKGGVLYPSGLTIYIPEDNCVSGGQVDEGDVTFTGFTSHHKSQYTEPPAETIKIRCSIDGNPAVEQTRTITYKLNAGLLVEYFVFNF